MIKNKRAMKQGIEMEIKNKKEKQIVLIILEVLVILLAIGCIVFFITKTVGKSSLQKHANQAKPMLESRMDMDRQVQTTEVLEEGQVLYEGKIYEYNEDILTFLCLGVDSRQSIQKEKTAGKAGQADTILLVVLDPHTESMKMLNISRDTIADIDIYDEAGLFSHTESTQLALQYAYGDGKEKSCELMEQAISKLFYGIPIHGYGAMDINAVGTLNDAVGGVELTVIEDLSRFSPDLALGNTLKLSGRQALHYVQERDVETSVLGANNLRIDRQKQFLIAFIQKVKAETKKNIATPISLYNIALENLVTSIGLDQATYLSSLALGYSFDMEDMISVVGTVEKKGTYEEFKIDEEAFYDLIINVFYEEIQ